MSTSYIEYLTKVQINKALESKTVNIFLSIRLNIVLGAQEPSHRDGSFEYPQHLFWLKNKKNNFYLHTLIWRHV